MQNGEQIAKQDASLSNINIYERQTANNNGRLSAALWPARQHWHVTRPSMGNERTQTEQHERHLKGALPALCLRLQLLLTALC